MRIERDIRQTVSILVLMDVVREGADEILETAISTCFNPCSNGCRSGSGAIASLDASLRKVSILVLMDVVREDYCRA